MPGPAGVPQRKMTYFVPKSGQFTLKEDLPFFFALLDSKCAQMSEI